jgi:hypothetical protein
VVPKKDGGKKQKLDTIVIVDDSKEVAELKRKLKEMGDQLTSMVVPSLPVPAQPVPVISAQLPIPPLPVPPFSGPPLPQICPPIQMPVPTVPLPSSPAMPPYSCEMQAYQHVQLHSSHVPVHAPAVRNIEETIFTMMEQSQAAERARYADREMCRLERENDFVRQQLSMHNIASFIARNYTSK